VLGGVVVHTSLVWGVYDEGTEETVARGIK
jgi:hypothetical protein